MKYLVAILLLCQCLRVGAQTMHSPIELYHYSLQYYSLFSSHASKDIDTFYVQSEKPIALPDTAGGHYFRFANDQQVLAKTKTKSIILLRMAQPQRGKDDTATIAFTELRASKPAKGSKKPILKPLADYKYNYYIDKTARGWRFASKSVTMTF
jgi:hypothetical protein